MNFIKYNFSFSLYKIIVFCVIFFINTFVRSQNSLNTDSLQQIITHSEHDTDIVNAYYNWGDFYWYSNPDSTQKYLKRCIDYIVLNINNEKNNNSLYSLKSALSTCYNDLGLIEVNKGNYNKANHYYPQALIIAEEIKDTNSLLSTLGNIAVLEYKVGNFKAAIETTFKKKKIAEKNKNLESIAASNNTIGSIYYVQNDLQKAAIYFQKSLDYKIKVNAKSVSLGYHNLASLYVKRFFLAKNKEAKDSLKSLAINYFKKAITLKYKNNDKIRLPSSLSALGILYYEIGQFQKANKYLEEALLIVKETENQNIEANILINLGRSYQKTKQIKKGNQLIKEGYHLSKKNGSPNLIKFTSLAMLELDTLAGNYKDAYYHYKESVAMNDSINNRSNYKKIEQQQAKFTYEKEAALDSIQHYKEIELTQIKQLQTEERSKSNLQLMLLFFGVILLIIALLIGRYRQKQKNKINSIEKRSLKIETQMLRSQMNPHFIFNSLNSIQSFISGNETIDAERYLSKFAKLMRLILENSRHPFITIENEIDTLSLYLELEKLRFNNRFKYTINSHNIDEEFTLIPPMLAQPYIENSILHGIATITNGKISIEYQQVGDKMICTIDDNGIGREQSTELKLQSSVKKSSLGIKVTQERIELLAEDYKLNLTINIIDKKDDNGNSLGTKVIIEMPWSE